MIIESKFKDYYDNISKYGVDKSVIYNRITTSIELDRHSTWRLKANPAVTYILKSKLNHNLVINDLVPFEGSSGYIVVCGKVYPYLQLNGTNDVEYLFNNSSLVDNENELVKKISDSFGRQSWRFSYGVVTKHLKETFNEEKMIRYHIDFNCPVFQIHYHEHRHNIELVLNPCLKDVDFHKVVDMYMIYQDIQSYVSNVLPNNLDKMVKLSDKSLIEKHGFNKNSFRNVK